MSHEASSSGEIFIGLLPPSPLQIDIASFEIKKGRGAGGGGKSRKHSSRI